MNGTLAVCSTQTGPVHEVHFIDQNGATRDVFDVTDASFDYLYGIEFDGQHLYLLYTL